MCSNAARKTGIFVWEFFSQITVQTPKRKQVHYTYISINHRKIHSIKVMLKGVIEISSRSFSERETKLNGR